MINQIIKDLKNLDKLTYKIMKLGIKFCFGICVLSILVLLTYLLLFNTPYLYYCGLLLFRISCIFAIEFIICGIVVDSIKKELI